MIFATCIKRYKTKNGIIVGYDIADRNGNTVRYNPMVLKNDIVNNKIYVNNLVLTMDGKLRARGNNKERQNKMSKQNVVNNVLLKSGEMSYSEILSNLMGKLGNRLNDINYINLNNKLCNRDNKVILIHEINNDDAIESKFFNGSKLAITDKNIDYSILNFYENRNGAYIKYKYSVKTKKDNIAHKYGTIKIDKGGIEYANGILSYTMYFGICLAVLEKDVAEKNGIPYICVNNSDIIEDIHNRLMLIDTDRVNEINRNELCIAVYILGEKREIQINKDFNSEIAKAIYISNVYKQKANDKKANEKREADSKGISVQELKYDKYFIERYKENVTDNEVNDYIGDPEVNEYTGGFKELSYSKEDKYDGSEITITIDINGRSSRDNDIAMDSNGVAYKIIESNINSSIYKNIDTNNININDVECKIDIVKNMILAEINGRKDIPRIYYAKNSDIGKKTITKYDENGNKILKKDEGNTKAEYEIETASFISNFFIPLSINGNEMEAVRVKVKKTTRTRNELI